MKHGIYYSTRPLPSGSHGILVSIWRNGRWLETNQNTQPWPTSAVALDRAKRTAMATRENGDKEISGLPLIEGVAK